MSSGFIDALTTTSGDGINGFPVHPGDSRWANVWENDEWIPLDIPFGELSKTNPKAKIQCSCGAVKTPNSNLHARYCDLFRDPMGGY